MKLETDSMHGSDKPRYLDKESLLQRTLRMLLRIFSQLSSISVCAGASAPGVGATGPRPPGLLRKRVPRSHCGLSGTQHRLSTVRRPTDPPPESFADGVDLSVLVFVSL